MMDKFVGRIKELETLEKQYSQKGSSFVVVYGRRRVGKTALINEFLKRHTGTLYFLATEESEKRNLAEFRAAAADYTGNGLLKNADVGWEQVFGAIVGTRTGEKKIIVIDEFSYLCAADKAFPSVMQKIWDSLLQHENVMLILCGSLVSLMRSQTLDYSSPLYGRRTAQIRLRQVPFRNYNEFFDGRTDEELIPFYAVTGGVPKYIETFLHDGNIYDAIRDNVLDSQSYLYEEPYFLLQKEVSEIGSYFSLIRAIAMGNRKLADIAAAVGVRQTSLTKYLNTLAELDLVEREVPVTEASPEKSKNGQYRITDNFIAFWFKFVYPYRSYLERGETEYVLGQIKKGFVQNYLSFVYEDICRERMWDLSAEGTWDFRFDRLGRYWGRLTGEIDVLAVDTAGGRLIAGECKYSAGEKGLSVFHTLREKAQAVAAAERAEDIRYIIFSSGGFTKGLLEEAEKNPSLTLAV